MRNALVPVSVCAAIVVLVGGLSGGSEARANGVFPSAGQLVLDPGDPAHMVLRTTYGLVSTRAGGDPWDWTCESGVGYDSGVHPPVAMTADGSVLAGLADGLVVARGDGCSWERAAELEGVYVVDLSAERSDPAHAVAITTAGAAGGGDLWETLDNGATWSLAGALPAGFIAVTVDAAPSNPQRVYASGVTGDPGKLKGALAVSDNRGKDWALFTVPQSAGVSAPYLGAIDPMNADRAYLRLGGTPGRLLVYDHASGSFTEVLTSAGLLRGFALSPDGEAVLVGDSEGGVFRAPVATFAFEQVSDVNARCLVWTGDGIYACGTEAADGFTVGFMANVGEMFVPLLEQACVRGPLACAKDTSAGAVCAADWPAVAAQIDWPSCHGGGTTGSGTGGGGGTAGTGGTTETAGGGGTTSGNAGAATCGCHMTGEGDDGAAWAAIGLAAWLSGRRRRSSGALRSVPRGRA